MSKHTPGPWHVGGDIRVTNDNRIHRNVWGPTPAGMQSGEMICQLATVDNARLIAAAPELLGALIDLADWLAYGLNKAEGAEPTAEDHAACARVAAKARAAVDKATGPS